MIRTSSTATPTDARPMARNAGFTLIEAIVMTVLLGLLTGMVLLNVSGIAFSSRSSMETAELVSTLRQAYGSAIQGGRRFEVRLDLAQQSYLMRTLTPANYGQPPEQEEVIDERQLDDQCRIQRR
jgi:Tfp pilus assembly protein FimT